MQSKVVTLSRGAVLWHAGDAAREVAVVESGKLGAYNEHGLVGVIWPAMVLGETALLALDGGPDERRTATVSALEDETRVTAYPAEAVRDAIAGGDDSLTRRVLETLVGQICRNLLIVLSARRGQAHLEAPLQGLLRGIVDDAASGRLPGDWEAFRTSTRFLSDVRDMSERALETFGPDPVARGEMVEGASRLLGEILGGREAPSGLQDFLRAEREKSEWWARGQA
jgi:CRP-like cAMP-binding protein